MFHLPRQSFGVIGKWTVGNLGERKMNWAGRWGVPKRSPSIPLASGAGAARLPGGGRLCPTPYPSAAAADRIGA
ncbi:hypothetical protein GCM10010433_58260 [Streptomyces pulveraceus]